MSFLLFCFDCTFFLLLLIFLIRSDYPDTKAGREYWKEKEKCSIEKDRRRPPLKRYGREGLDVSTWNNVLWDEQIGRASCRERVLLWV